MVFVEGRLHFRFHDQLVEEIVWKGKLCLDSQVGFSKDCECAGTSGW